MVQPVAGEPVDAVRFGVLGPLLVVDGSGATRAVSAGKQRVVLAALLFGSGHVVSAEGLAEALWDASQPPNASAVMRTYVMRLRRVLGPVSARIVGRPGGWAVDLRGPEEFDLAAVDDLWRAAQTAAETGEWRRVSSLLGGALSLWRGEPLADVPSSALARREAGRLAELRLALTEAQIDADLRLGRHGELVAELRRLAAEHPLREHVRAQLMLACYRCGHQAAALEVYRDARAVLAEELGVEPGRELRELHQKILTGDAGLAVPEPGGGTVRLREEPLAVPKQLPAAPGHLIGRRAELERLAGLQGEIGGGAVTAVSGMAGVGKTTLALHWAHRVAGRFPDGQLYADLGGFGPSGTPIEPAAALQGFLDALGVPAERIPRGLQARAGLFRSLAAGRRMLIVLDNARDAEQVRPLLPGSPGCRVLVTSRDRLAGLVADGNAGLLVLDVLSKEEAGQLLAARLGTARLAAEPGAASELTGLCARLPLALAIAAARAVAYPELPLAALTAELRDAALRLDGLDTGDAATSVRAVLSWSYRQLPEPAARMLRLLSVHPGPGVTAAAAASLAGIPVNQARRTLRVLAAANLITEYLPGRYALHDLLRAFAAELARAAGHAEEHRAAIRRTLDHYLHTANAASLITGLTTPWERDQVTLEAPQPDVSPETFAARDQALSWFDAEHALLVRLTRQAAETGFDVHVWQLAHSLEVFFRLQGHWHDHVATQRIALAAARRLSDQDVQARVHCQLGFALGEGGRFRQARVHLARALELYQALGDQEGQARVRICAGLVWSWQGHYREALAATRAALPPPTADEQTADETLSRERRATVLNNLGWFHAQLGELDQARTHCQRALELYRDVGSRYGEAVTLDSLAYICDQAGDHAQAIAHYRLAADLLREIGALHEAAAVLGRLGDSRQAAAEPAGARDAWQQAIQILDGMQHPGARESLAKLRELGGTE
jgi:DNA-binding SARP family transcriptional activator/tetratricopeptide (TPR) repeat protein